MSMSRVPAASPSTPDVGARTRVPTAREDPGVARAVALARTLDDRWVDPLVGMSLPAAGALITAAAGVYLVAVAIRRGLPAVVVARMLLHLAIDMLLGAVPVLGDIFDFVYKANAKNARLLLEREPGKSTTRDWVIVIGAALLFVATITIPIATLAWALGKVFG